MINDLLYKLVSPRPMDFFRVVWSMFLVYYLIDSFWIYKLYFGDDGILAADVYQFGQGTLQWSVFNWVVGDIVLTVISALVVLSSLGMMVGLGIKWNSVISFICLNSLVAPVQWGGNSADQLVVIISFLIMVNALAGHLGGYCTLGLLNRNSQSGKEGRMIPVWSYRVFQFQLCAVYFFSGLQKAGRVDWQNGQALDIILHQTDTWMRYDLKFFLEYPAVTAIGTTLVLLFELILFPLLVWFEKTRKWVLLAGVGFHLSIIFFMKVFIFSEVMILMYFCFLTDQEIRNLSRVIGNRLKINDWKLA
jgi:hypothetical protein